MENSTENILFKKMPDFNDKNFEIMITKTDYRP